LANMESRAPLEDPPPYSALYQVPTYPSPHPNPAPLHACHSCAAAVFFVWSGGRGPADCQLCPVATALSHPPCPPCLPIYILPAVDVVLPPASAQPRRPHRDRPVLCRIWVWWPRLGHFPGPPSHARPRHDESDRRVRVQLRVDEHDSTQRARVDPAVLRGVPGDRAVWLLGLRGGARGLPRQRELPPRSLSAQDHCVGRRRGESM